MGAFDAQRIHEASLQILETVGVRLEHDEIYQRILRAGGRPGPKAYEVRLARDFIHEHLLLAPREFALGSPQGDSMTLTPDSAPLFWTNPALQISIDGEVRAAHSNDLARVARLSEHLQNVHGVMGMAISDVPPPHRDFTGVRIIAENCNKHVRALCFTPRGMEALGEMSGVFPGHWLSIGFTAHGPLRWTHLALEIFRKSSGRSIPATINGEPMAGVTGPVTPAGSMVVGNAEILAGIIVNQILEPGRPVIYNLGLAHVFDMRHATAVTGGPENAFFAEASARMGRFYQIPSGSWVSTDSLFDDSQASLEKTFGFHTHIDSGVNLVWGMGQLESEKTLSLTQLVLDNEIIDYIKRFRRSFVIDDETLQLELIKEVGIAGSFLETAHTLHTHRACLWNPGLLNRRSRKPGLKPLEAVGSARVRQLLSLPAPTRTAPDPYRELKRIEDFYRGKPPGSGDLNPGSHGS